MRFSKDTTDEDTMTVVLKYKASDFDNENFDEFDRALLGVALRGNSIADKLLSWRHTDDTRRS